MKPVNPWLILFVLFVSTFSFLFSMQIVPPILPAIIKESGVNYAEAGSLISLVAFPAILISIPGGVLIGKLGAKLVGVIGFLIVTLSSLASFMTDAFLVLQFSRFILGFGGALGIVSSQTLITQWFHRRKLAFAMGVFGLNMPLATISAFNLMGRISSLLGWRSCFLISFLVNFASLLVFILLVKERGEKRLKSFFRGLRNRDLWLIGFTWATFNMAAISFTTWGKTILMEFKGLNGIQSDFLASMIMIGALATPITGYVSDKLQRRKPFILLSAISMAVVFIFIPELMDLYLFSAVALLGVAAAFLPPSIFALPSEIIDPRSLGVAYGVLNTCLNIGITTGPFLVGLTLDFIGGQLIVYGLMALFSILTFLFALSIKAR